VHAAGMYKNELQELCTEELLQSACVCMHALERDLTMLHASKVF
jgi:hypothetical protein